MGFDYARDASGIVTVTMDMDGQSANTMTQAYHDLMRDTVARLEREAGLTGVIIASAKKTFFAGGDLHGLYAADCGDAAYQRWLDEDKGFLRSLERLPVPVVAAINGAALGGGLEICLACTHRIIADDPKAITGLPEVTLGLLPGAGGTARLPRLIALQDALDLLLSGRTMPPAEALALGVVNQIVPAERLLDAARHWLLAHPQGRAQQEAVPEPEATAQITAARTRVLRDTRGLMPGPLKILDIVEFGLTHTLDETLAFETVGFASLIGLPETRAAIWSTFLAANAIRSGKLAPAKAAEPVKTLSVQGAALTTVAKAAARRVTLVEEGADLTLSETADVACDGAMGLLAPARQAGAFGFSLWPQQGRAKIVELSQQDASDADFAKGYDLLRRIGLTPIVVHHGSYLDRLTQALTEETARLTAEGISPEMIAASAEAAGFGPITDGGGPVDQSASQRLVYAVALAGLTALADGTVRTAEEADMAAILGAGFPRHLGGPVQMLRGLGADAFRARVEALGLKVPPLALSPARQEETA